MATTHGTVHALPFAPGALFELRGEVSMLGFRFQSSAASPLLFVVARDGRFVHMGGEGVVSSGGGLCTVLR
jgi:hypothetical protein